MEKLIAVICILICLGAFTQNERIEKKEWTENGVTKGYTIVTEYDENGKVLKKDSTYSERTSGNGADGNFNFYFEGPGNSEFHFHNFSNDSTFQNNFYSFGTDSTFFEQFRSHKYNIDQYLKEYRQFLHEQLEIPIDSIPPADQIIYPEKSKVKKI